MMKWLLKVTTKTKFSYKVHTVEVGRVVIIKSKASNIGMKTQYIK